MPAGSVDLLATYPVLFLGCALSGLGFPLPEDVVLLWAGIQIAHGGFVWERAIPVALAGIFVRDVLAWLLGRVLGEKLLSSRLAAKVLPVARIGSARSLVARRGAVAVLVGRLAVGFRVPIFVAAGLSGVGAGTMIAVDGVAMLLTVPLEVALGARFGPPVLDVAARVLGGTGMLWATLAAVVALVVLKKRRPEGTDAP